MRPLFLAMTFLACCSGLAQSPGSKLGGGEENAGGIIHGTNHAYMIQAPKGWVLDNEIWAKDGIFAVFYKAGQSLMESPIVAYTMVQEKTPAGIEAHMNADLAGTVKGSKTAKIERLKTIKTSDGRDAFVFKITGIPKINPELAAYIDAPTVVIFVSVSVRNIKDIPQGKILLDKLISSVSWLSDSTQYTK